MKDSVIVLSGGMDSTTMLYEYKENIALAITFDYGSIQNAEEQIFASLHCRKLSIQHLIIPLDFMHKYFKSALLSSPEDIPTINYDEENMKSTVVPFRNGIMLSIACGIAESNNLNRVLIANHSGDHSIYPDCRPEFIESIAKTISLGTYRNIEVFAPYTNLSKKKIAEKGNFLGIDYSETYSCYKGGRLHCGKCATCRERREALLMAGIPDNTKYEE